MLPVVGRMRVISVGDNEGIATRRLSLLKAKSFFKVLFAWSNFLARPGVPTKEQADCSEVAWKWVAIVTVETNSMAPEVEAFNDSR